jgi:hypothetical protein
MARDGSANSNLFLIGIRRAERGIEQQRDQPVGK